MYQYNIRQLWQQHKRSLQLRMIVGLIVGLPIGWLIAEVSK